MDSVLIAVTLVEVVVVIAVLAIYLIAITRALRRVSQTLGLVTFGVRAIEKQTEPLGPVLRDINGALEQVAAALGHGTATAQAAEAPPAQPAAPPPG